MQVLERMQMIIALIFLRVLPVGWPATGRERRGKRLVFEILFVITITVID